MAAVLSFPEPDVRAPTISPGARAGLASYRLVPHGGTGVGVGRRPHGRTPVDRWLTVVPEPREPRLQPAAEAATRRVARRGRSLEVATWARVATVATVAALVAVTVALPGFVSWVAGPDPAAAVAPAVGAGGVAAGGRYQVQPGDSLWSIAARLQPAGDVRPLVDLLVAANGGSTVVHPGQELVLSP